MSILYRENKQNKNYALDPTTGKIAMGQYAGMSMSEARVSNKDAQRNYNREKIANMREDEGNVVANASRSTANDFGRKYVASPGLAALAFTPLAPALGAGEAYADYAQNGNIGKALTLGATQGLPGALKSVKYVSRYSRPLARMAGKTSLGKRAIQFAADHSNLGKLDKTVGIVKNAGTAVSNTVGNAYNKLQSGAYANVRNKVLANVDRFNRKVNSKIIANPKVSSLVGGASVNRKTYSKGFKGIKELHHNTEKFEHANEQFEIFDPKETEYSGPTESQKQYAESTPQPDRFGGVFKPKRTM